MQFNLIHEVGNRTRWRTRSSLSEKSAAIVAADLEAIEGVTGLVVNPRTGSVIVTVAHVKAREALCAYFEGLRTKPPVLRHGDATAKAAFERAAREKSASRARPRAAAKRVADAADKLVGGMPVMQLVADVKHVFERVGSRRAAAALPREAAPEGELDFGPLARYVFLRPFLPMIVNTANAVLGSVPFLLSGVKALSQGKLNVAVLDAAALGVSLLRRDFKTAGLLIVLLGLGEMLEAYTRKRSMSKLADELALNVDAVWVKTDAGQLAKKSLKEVTLEDRVVVHAGSAIPVDGIVLEGEGAVNQAGMTGEALPVHKTAGGTLFAGTVLEEGELTIKPTALGEGTRLTQIVRFIETSEAAKAGIQGKAERWADRIVPFNFLLAGLVWFFTRDLNRTASVLMVDFSCALRLATPLAILTAMRSGTHEGVVVKGGRFLEALAEVDTVVFDKTGTLTKSTPVLSDVVSFDESLPEDEALRLAACLEEHFPHPVGRAVVRAAEERGLTHYEENHDAKVDYIVAHGISSAVDGQKVILGSRHFVEDDEGIDVSAARETALRLANEGKSILYMAVAGKLVALLGIVDPVRAEAAQVVSDLRRTGIKRIVMLTGDDERTAAAVARELGIDDYKAGILPAQKAEVVLALKAAGAKVLMVGDGINDSPALSAADVGVTLRDGADIAREVADVVLTGNDLTKLVPAIELGRACMRRIRQNFVASVGLNGLFLAGGLSGLLMPAAGALLHNGTTIGICLNAMRHPHEKGWDFDRTLGNAGQTLGQVKAMIAGEGVSEAHRQWV